MRSVGLVQHPFLCVILEQVSRPGIRGKRIALALLACLGLSQTLWGQGLQLVPTINAIAGTGISGNSGDGGLAISAQLGGPLSTVHDASGNLYIADTSNSCVRKVAYGTGIITTLAGTGTAGFSGDEGPATGAELKYPRSVALDTVGNLYIADTGNNRVRVVNLTTGTITTVAGTNTAGYNGDQISATGAQLNGPDGLVFDSAGNLYIADVNNYRVRMVAGGTISTWVGDGTAGSTGENVQATAAEINQVSRMAFDAAGNLYLADYGNQVVRMVTSAGVITTVAGTTGSAGFSGDGGPPLSAQLNGPAAVAVDNAGNILILDSANQRVRMISASTTNISTIAGTGTVGDANGPALTASFSVPLGIESSNGAIYVADTGNNQVRALATNPAPLPGTQVGGSVTQIVFLQVTGAPASINSFTFAQSQGGSSEFTAGTVTGCAVDGTTPNAVGTICTVPVTFTPAYTGIRRMPLVVVTSGGKQNFGLSGTGLGSAVLVSPGTITGIAGAGTPGYTGDTAAATSATLNTPQKSIVDNAGNIYIVDTGNNVIREIAASSGTSSGTITTIAGNNVACSSTGSACGDGGPATSASLNGPTGVAVDAAGNLYIADTLDNSIREVDAVTGFITTIAGTNAPAYTGDGGPAVAATLNGPEGVAVDLAGNLYIADTGNNAIREINAATGIIVTVAGNDTGCATVPASCGDGGAATAANLDLPAGVAVDSSENIYIADTEDEAVREVTPSTGNINTVAGNGSGGYGGDGSAATNANLNAPSDVAVDSAGNLYIADSGNNVVRLVQAANGTIATIAGTNATPCGDSTTACGDAGPSTGASFNMPGGVALDGAGNLYVTDTSDNRIRQVNAAALSLTFAPTPVGATSADSPQLVTLYSTGTSALNFPVPASGTDPVISTGFTLDGSGTCPQYDSSTGAGQLASGDACTYAVDFAPATEATITGTLVITDDSLNATAPAYASQTIALNGMGTARLTLTTSNANPLYGQSVTFTDTIATVSAVPTGSVSFYNGSTLLGTGSLDGTGAATLTTTALPAGTDTVTAVYSGDSKYAQATSNAVVETVTKSSGVESLTTSNASPTFGQSVTLTDTIPTVNGTVPTGTVSFYYGFTKLGKVTVDGSGVATLATTGLPGGTETVIAFYSGDANYGQVISNGVTETVAPVTSTDRLTTSNASPSFGQSITLTDTIILVNSVAPTGTVTFSDGATVIGTGSVNASGIATLATASLPAGTDTITAAYGGDGNYASLTAGPLTETVTKSGGTETLTTSNASPNYGQSITLTDTLQTVGGIIATGTVTFYNGTAAIGTGTVGASGAATLTTASLPSGSDSITAVYSGDGNYAGGTAGPIVENVSKSATTDALTTSNASINLGQAVTFTDAVPVVNGIAPTGTVTFYQATTAIGTGMLNGAGQATVTTSALPAGSDAITAVYPGDTSYLSSNAGPLAETVAKNAAADALTASTLAPAGGVSVTFTDTIPVVPGFTPTGTVTFYNGTAVIGTGTVTVSGVATVAASSLPAGADSITAVYGGDSNYASVTAGPITVTVGKASGSGVLTSSNLAPTVGQSVTFTDTLPAPNGVVATGTVTFYNGTTTIGTGTVNAAGIATFTTAALPAGTDSITAAYSGDASYGSSTAGPLVETVGKAYSTDALTSSNQSPALGQAVTFTDTLTVMNGMMPTGTVTFYNGATAIGTGTVNASGVATLTTGSLPAGMDSITAVYGGDSNDNTATAGPLVETVAKAAGNAVLTSSNLAPVVGVSVTFTDTIALLNGVAATGSVTFFDGSTAMGTGTVSATGVATLTTASLPAGNDAITAVYGGDGDYLSSTAGPVTEVVTMPAVQTQTVATLTASTNAITLGQSVTFTSTITLAGAVAPTGTVTFSDGTAVLGTGAINASGVATLSTAALPVGANSVTVSYAGDANYGPATAGPVMVTVSAVAAADFTISATPANPSVIPGGATSYTISLAGLHAAYNLPVTLSATGLPPGAVVSFTPASVVPGAGPATTMMKVQTSAAQARLSPMGSLPKIAYGLLLLPLLGVGRFRRKLHAIPVAVAYVFAVLAVLGSMTGCGGGSVAVPPQQYTITVTGSSNTLQHSTKVTLTVQ